MVTAAHAAGRPVSVCGEMAADPLGATALAALGVDCLSVPVTQLPAARQAVAGLDPAKLAPLRGLLLRAADGNRGAGAAAGVRRARVSEKWLIR